MYSDSNGFNEPYESRREEVVSEDAEVKRYVLTKSLSRPGTNAVTVISFAVKYSVVSFAVGYCAIGIFGWQSYAAYVYIVSYLLCFIFAAKSLCIISVKCYQHYAKEKTRRKCTCKPTCSEYALAVLDKYWLPIALHKIRIRLFKTCGDGCYKVDLP